MASKTAGLLLLGGIALLGGITLYSMQQRKKKPCLFIHDDLPFNMQAVTIPPVGVFVSKQALCNEDLLVQQLINWKIYRDKGLFRYYFEEKPSISLAGVSCVGACSKDCRCKGTGVKMSDEDLQFRTK